MDAWAWRPEPQPTTVSHDGELADRPGARVPRCAPTGLSHAADAVDQSKLRRPDRTTAPEPSALPQSVGGQRTDV